MSAKGRQSFFFNVGHVWNKIVYTLNSLTYIEFSRNFNFMSLSINMITEKTFNTWIGHFRDISVQFILKEFLKVQSMGNLLHN